MPVGVRDTGPKSPTALSVSEGKKYGPWSRMLPMVGLHRERPLAWKALEQSRD